MSSYSHSTGTFIGKGGTEIFFQSWSVENPKGILVISHGVGEHSGRYFNIIKQLKGSRTSIYALDHRGHGKSGGKRGHVDSFMDYVYDLKLFIDLIKEENSNMPLVLLGHSMGGVIACKYAMTYSEDINALVLSSAGFIASVEVAGWKKSFGKVFSRYAPAFTMATGLDAKLLSHDADVVDAYENDRLVHGKVSARWYIEFVASGQECLVRAPELRMPLFVFHGKDDKIVDYRGSEAVFKSSSSTQKELHLFDGLYHETMNEKQNAKVLKTVAQWIIRIITKKDRLKP
ncbi:MAG: lysophospholipase [Spirochaetes bacterium]|nr:lysophospholipase [Spirochaetota bacterium]